MCTSLFVWRSTNCVPLFLWRGGRCSGGGPSFHRCAWLPAAAARPDCKKVRSPVEITRSFCKTANTHHHHTTFPATHEPLDQFSRPFVQHVCRTASQPQSRVKGKWNAECDPSQPDHCTANRPCLQRRGEALRVNISAGEGLQDVLKSNLGPLGTIKMYASSDAHLFPSFMLTFNSLGLSTVRVRYESATKRGRLSRC